MGCLCYLVSVLLLSWRHLEGDEFTRYLALAIGGISVLTVLVTVGLIYITAKCWVPWCGYCLNAT